MKEDLFFKKKDAFIRSKSSGKLSVHQQNKLNFRDKADTRMFRAL